MNALLNFTLLIILVGCQSVHAQLYKNKRDLYQYGLSSSIAVGFKFGGEVKVVDSFYGYGNINLGGAVNPDYVGLVTQLGLSATYNFFSSRKRTFASQLHSSVQLALSPYEVKKLNNETFYNQPFYGFANLSYPAIKNAYPLSLAIGTGCIVLLSKPGTLKDRTQRVGSIYGKFGNVHVFYQNDGVLPKFMADLKDRWYTSSFLVAWHSNNVYTEVNHLSFAYNRFTGYSPGNYELASALNNNIVLYSDSVQRQFNTDYTRFGIGLKHNRNIGFNIINSKYRILQGQKSIHYFRNNPYHPDNSKFHMSVEGAIRTE